MTVDELDIRAGGVIAVDTDSLRRVAGVLGHAAAECAEVAALLWRAGSASMRGGLFEPSPAGRAELARDRADALARALRQRADVYEAIEAEAARGVSAREVGGRTVSPQTRAEAERLLGEWSAGRHRDVQHQLGGAFPPLSPIAALVTWLTTLVRALDLGALGIDAPPLRGEGARVRVDELRRHPVQPPRSLADIAERMPEAADDRVRVEIYETADGREYVAYIAGTRDLWPPRDEPWDMASNGELYAGRVSSSLLAAYDAIEAAGARAGDRVHLVGHSQGGMIAGHLAREGGFDVATLITFATPVQVHPGDDVLTVTVRHTDDPIAALANGGLPDVAGSRDSFVVERLADPLPRLADFALGVHDMGAYRDTAALVDASDDVRVDALRINLAGLGAATSAVAVFYGARRDPAAPPRRRRLSASTQRFN